MEESEVEQAMLEGVSTLREQEKKRRNEAELSQKSLKRGYQLLSHHFSA